MLESSQERTVRVEFVRAGEDSPWAASDVPLGQLPETFEPESVLTIGDQKYSVVDAQPPAKSEFARTGRLKLRLREIVNVPVNDLWFPVPTLSKFTPPARELVAASSLEDILIVHGNDWQQMEFVSAAYLPAIQGELEQVRKAYETRRNGCFGNLHVREAITAPLRGTGLTPAAVQRHFRVARVFKGVALTADGAVRRSWVMDTFSNIGGMSPDRWAGQAAVVERGFGFETKESAILWGLIGGDGNATCLCADGRDIPREDAEFLKSVQALAVRFSLCFVNWVGMFILPTSNLPTQE